MLTRKSLWLRRRNERHAGALVRTTTPRSLSRKDGERGRLAVLMDMPLDIFYEIMFRLTPLDILHFSRLSHHMRALFTSKSARHIWLAARHNIAGLPECPGDMSEMQYASLLFEKNCHTCHSKQAQKVDYALRLRFCAQCLAAHVRKGSQVIKKKIWHRREVVFTLLPRSRQKMDSYHHYIHNLYSPSPAISSLTNTPSNAYYVPELELVLARYLELEAARDLALEAARDLELEASSSPDKLDASSPDKLELDAFVKEQQAVATRIMKVNMHHWQSALEIETWEREWTKEKWTAGSDRSKQRRTA
ncbi:hypothetical protein PLICRDRAFT_430736 [Plicaturopsis crispa FD-325 SS-3]|uniref:F-box domain-containing protein n=1 Tax=Plicaturopsis crispa FD-325 SS-3 TaxID=944288 RepID=A0A0C9SQK8_PLICR|nr:hypothetical protein PLICRDRAFT_430736 [Plicaturopsis crispa FD-325 SS-3]